MTRKWIRIATLLLFLLGPCAFSQAQSLKPVLFNLSAIRDVSKTAPTDGQFLKYVSSTGLWTPATASGTGDMLEATWATGGLIKVAKGGTGVAAVTANSYLKGNGTAALVERTYAEVRTDLGLVIGTNVQAYDADLTTYAGITPSANVQTILGAADFSAMRTSLGLVIGTNVQAYDSDLTTWAGVTPSANGTALVSAANYTAMRDLLDVVAGTDVQAYDADLATLAGSTAWRVFYSNGTSVITQLALGGAGTYLQSNGASAAPTWVTPAGVGDVVGPAAATDLAAVRYDSTTGKLVQDSVLIVSDTGVLQIPEAAAPGAGAANTARIYAFNKPTSGFTVLNYVDSSGMVRELVRDSVIICYNSTVSTITAGKAVYHIGTLTNGYPNIALARANAIATMPAIGISCESIAASAYGRVMQVGMLENVDTSGTTAGDPMYVSGTTAGAVTTTPPVTPNLRQEVGAITIVDASVGAMQVVARSLSQNDTGTAINDWIVGDGTAGAKRMLFRAGIDGILTWSPTSSTKTITLPDATGTVQLVDADLTTLATPTNWRVFYSNGSNTITELALGADGTYLRSNGASAAPTFSTPAGAGDVVGPGSATDNAAARFDATTGKLLQNGVLVIGDTGIVTGGTWQGTVVAPTYGGTGANTVAMTGYPYMTLGIVSQDAILTKYSTTGIQVNNGANYARMYHDGTNTNITTNIGKIILDSGDAATPAALEFSDDDTNYVTVSAQEMAADWTLTLPAVVPAANNTPLVGSTAGTLTWGTDLATATTIGSGYIYRAAGTDIPVTDGGTGLSTLTTAYGLLAAGTTATGTVQTLAAGLATQILVGGGTGALPAWGTDIPTAVTIGGAYLYRVAGTDVAATDGGTGQSAYVVGDLLYASSTTALSRLAASTAGYVLTSGGAGVAPTWATPAAAVAHNLLSAAHTDTTAASPVVGDLIIGGAGPVWTKLADVAVGSVLISGGVGAVPSWGTADAAVSASSTTVAGKVELAIASEVNTGTDATRAVSPDSLAGSIFGTKNVILKVMAEATVVTSGDGKMYFTIPVELNGMNLVSVGAHIYTADDAQNMDIDIYNVTAAEDMLSTAMRIESTEVDTITSAQPGTIDGTPTAVATGNVIRVDVTTFTGTVGAGLEIRLGFRLP